MWTQAASICPLYSLAVTAEDGRRYRNPHCAACNGRDLNMTSCDLSVTSCDPNTTSCDPGPAPRRRPASGVLARLMVPALTFLLQFRPGQVSSHHTATMQEVQVSGADCQGCEAGQFYDGLQGECYSLQCGHGDLNIGGRCVRWGMEM